MLNRLNYQSIKSENIIGSGQSITIKLMTVVVHKLTKIYSERNLYLRK